MPESTIALPLQARPASPGMRALALVSAGGALEFYDFHLFGLFSPSIAAAFFPSHDRFASMAMTFGVFAAGYLARPLGGLLFGHMGDRHGRKHVFLISLLITSLCTAGFALVPTYAQWGLASPLLILVLRCVQGFCLGGELPMAVTYAVESSGRRAGLACGLIFACVNLGVAASSLLAWIINTVMPAEQAFASGWRIAFLVGGVLGVGSLWLRRRLTETPDYERIRANAARRPVSEVLVGHWRAVLAGAGAMAAPACFNALLFTHMTSYMANLNYAPAQVSQAQTAAVATLSVGLIASAWIGDRVSRPWVVAAGASLLIAFSYPFYSLLIAHAASPVLLFCLAAGAASLVNGAFACMAAQLFPTRIRFSGAALAINCGFTLFGGVAPLAAASAIAWTRSPAAPALIMGGCGVLSLLGSLAAARLGRTMARASGFQGVGEGFENLGHLVQTIGPDPAPDLLFRHPKMRLDV